MIFDLIDLAKLRRAFVYALLLLVLFLLQNVLFANLAIAGVRAMFVPISVVCVALFEGGVWGALYGLAAGFFLDMGMPDSTVLFLILLPVIGFFCGALCHYVLRRGFLTALVLSAGTLLLTALCQMFPFLFSGTKVWAVIGTGLLQVLWSLPFILIIYYPCRAIAQRDMTD